MIRKKHDPPKNIRRKDQDFSYYIFEVDTGIKEEVIIHKETRTIFDVDEYINEKINEVHNLYNPINVHVEISPLGKWEYNELKNRGVELLYKN
tara:strand:+ start:3060 stop:3338 length:279 start_codon:yes stop_codon:yes gene_type:complete